MALAVRRRGSFESPGLREAWEQLSNESPRASIFSTYVWCRHWFRTVGQAVEPAILVVEDTTSEVVGLLPVCIERTRPSRWLKFMGRERASGDHLDLLCSAANHDACLTAILDYIDGCDDFHGLLLGELQCGERTLNHIRQWAAASSYDYLEREHRVVPFVDLPGSLDDYLAQLSANMRYHIRRRRRGFDAHANCSLRLYRGGPELDAVLTDFFRLHEARWRQVGEAGLYRDEQMQTFLRSFCHEAGERGWLRCHVLELCGETHCVLIAFHWGRVASFYQMGWNPRCPLKSPGVIVMAESIAQAIREKMARYDFLRGDEAYKTRWTSQWVEQRTAVIGCRLPARADMAAERMKNRLKGAFQRTLGVDNWERFRRLVRG